MGNRLSKVIVEFRGDEVKIRTYKAAMGRRHALYAVARGKKANLRQLLGGSAGNPALGLPPNPKRAT
jgi:hypothetical protein